MPCSDIPTPRCPPTPSWRSSPSLVFFVVAAFRGMAPAVTGVAVTVVAALILGSALSPLISGCRALITHLRSPASSAARGATLAAYVTSTTSTTRPNYDAATTASGRPIRQRHPDLPRCACSTQGHHENRPLNQQSRLSHGFNSGSTATTWAGERRDTVISVRELNLNPACPPSGRHWVNQHRLHARLRRGRRLR